AAAISAQAGAPDAKPSLLPLGLGAKNGEFNKIFLDTFQQVVLRKEDPRSALEQQGKRLSAIMTESGAPCWAPDAPSQGPCPVPSPHPPPPALPCAGPPGTRASRPCPSPRPPSPSSSSPPARCSRPPGPPSPPRGPSASATSGRWPPI